MDPNNLKGLVESYKQVHAGQQELDEAYLVTNADKKANTKAYQNYKAGMKGKDGKPLYKAADHMKEGVRDTDPEKGTAERKARLEKKRGMKLDDHPQYKKNDGNLANNYPPYDKVTRGDVIAGATGKDQMGGKKKVKEEAQQVDEATAMAKRGYDEAPIRQKIAKSTGGGKAADRATALEKKPTYGNDKAGKQRSDYARKQRGDFRKTTSSSPGLHGYGHKSDDPKVKAKQAARGAQRGALTPNEKKELNREQYERLEATGLFTAEEIERILDIMCD